jgi:hypothetical protein
VGLTNAFHGLASLIDRDGLQEFPFKLRKIGPGNVVFYKVIFKLRKIGPGNVVFIKLFSSFVRLAPEM